MRTIITLILILSFILPVYGSKEDLALLPHTISAVYSVNVQISENIGFLKEITDKGNLQIDNFKKLTGIDIKKDVITVTFAVKDPEAQKKEKVIAGTVLQSDQCINTLCNYILSLLRSITAPRICLDGETTGTMSPWIISLDISYWGGFRVSAIDLEPTTSSV